MKSLSLIKIFYFIITIFFVVLFFILNIKSVEAQTADGACSGGSTVLEKSCTFQKGVSRISGKCQLKDKKENIFNFFLFSNPTFFGGRSSSRPPTPQPPPPPPHPLTWCRVGP